MRRLWLFLSFLAVLACVTCCPIGQRVTLRTEDGKTVYAARVPRGQLVFILYRHSVNKGLVEDGFEPVGDKLKLKCSRFRQYGAGIPEPEAGQVFRDMGEYYELTGFDLTLETQWTFVGRLADHRLRIGDDGEIVHYNQLAEPGTRLGLSCDRWSILKEIIWRCRRIG